MNPRQPLTQVKTVPIPLGNAYKMRVRYKRSLFMESVFLWRDRKEMGVVQQYR